MRIGQASIDERGTIAGGQAGNQSGKELNISSWYQGNWTLLIRPSSAELGARMAAACEEACANPCIGYDQSQRNTGRKAARSANWVLGKITTRCEVDCSSLMALCAEAAGVNMDNAYERGNAPCTFNMAEMFGRTGDFFMLRDSKYLNGTDFLRRGDILVDGQRHTVMVLDNGPKAFDKNSKIMINGAAYPIDRMLVGGRNYFQLRELLDVFHTAGIVDLCIGNQGSIAVLTSRNSKQ